MIRVVPAQKRRPETITGDQWDAPTVLPVLVRERPLANDVDGGASGHVS